MNAIVILVCEGCHKSERHPMLHGEENQSQKEEWASRGWRRKAFWPSNHPTLGWDKGPWFCSDECATESISAKQAEAYWKNYNIENDLGQLHSCCSRPHIRPLVYVPLLLAVLFIFCLIGDCIRAGLH